MRKAIPVLLLCHLLCCFIYLYLKDNIELVTNKNTLNLFYYGTETLFTGLFILFACSNSKTWLETQLCWVEGGQILVRGLIYDIHYSNIYAIGTIHRVLIIISYLLIASIIIITAGWKNGFFKRID